MRPAIVVTIVAVIVNLVLTGLGPSGFYATFGVFILLVLSDFGGPLRTRFLAYLATGAGGLVMIVLGTLAATSLAAAIVVTALVGFALAYALMLRGYLAPAFLSLLLPYIVAVTTPTTMSDLAIGLASYAAAAVIAAIAAVTMWPEKPDERARQAVASVVSAAAEVVGAATPARPGAPAGDAESQHGTLVAEYTALHTLFDGDLARPGDLTAADHALVRLVDDVSRLRFALDWMIGESAPATAADITMLSAARDTLTACATALSARGALADETVAALYAAQAEHVDRLPAETDRLLAEARPDEAIAMVDAGFRYRVIAVLTATVAGHTLTAVGHRPGPGSTGPIDPVRTEITRLDRSTGPAELLRSNLTIRSPWLRRGVQTAVAVAAAVVAVHEMHLEVGFWVVLGIVASLQFTAIRARKSAVEVAGGTLVGFAICAALVHFVGKNTPVLVAVLIPVAFLTVWLPRGRLLVPLKQAGFTVWFVMLVSLAHGGLSMRIDDVRIEDVGTGLVISLAITAVLWPRGVATRVRDVLHSSAAASGDFVAAAYAYLGTEAGPADRERVERAAQSAVHARDLADEAFDVALAEGGAAHDDAKAWTTVANAVDHAMVVGTMVRGLEGYGLAPLADRVAAQQLHDVARSASAEFAAATDPGSARASESAAAPAAQEGTADAVSAAVRGWSGRREPLTVTGATGPMSPGHAAIGLLWARDWATYFRWMVGRSRPVTPDSQGRSVSAAG